MQPAVLVLLSVVFFVAVSIPTLIILVLKERKRRAVSETRVVQLSDEVEGFRQRFSGAFSLDAEIDRLKAEIGFSEQKNNSLKGKMNAEREVHELAIIELRKQYSEKKAIYERLRAEVAIFDERLAFAEMGVYEPHFDFGDSENYKSEIERVRDLQKSMVSEKKAVICTQQWTVDGDLKKGKVMTDRNIRLTVRAFNNECEASISNTRWNNVNAMEKRIAKAKEQIDKLNASNLIFISNDFFAAKLREMYLTHEYREKLKEERDDRLEAARLQKEEQKLLRDKEDAEAEANRYARLLEKARVEAANRVGAELNAYTNQIVGLENDLAEARAKAERAQALAELTRSGFVYIISNIGSFGEGVIKIGMTRRLDPLDRVRELGSASVPFTFDVHAIIYSDDAPTLEHALHSSFASNRVNMQNFRKEFFRAEIHQVESAVKRLAPSATFIKDVEAQEYRETVFKRNMLLGIEMNKELEAFPAEI